MKKADTIRDLHIVHVSSTFYGGGVTEILTPLTLIMNTMGIETGWRMIQGTPAFFNITKKLHNALQGYALNLASDEIRLFEQITFENALRLHVEDRDVIIVHDPQPLGLISEFPERVSPWIWQCHVDLSDPHPQTWDYISKFVEQYQAVVFSLPEYRQDLATKQHFIAPAINPFSEKNCDLSDAQVLECLDRHQIATNRPIIAQVSRFDPWKDPVGVIEAFRKASKEVDSTLVLLGNLALDDPEANIVLAPVMPGQTVAVEPEEVKAFRPTYRLLSYCLASGGFPVRNDLAGVDRPDLVDALAREIHGWAGLTPPC